MLYELHDKLILQYKGWLFVWEPAWERFRPIQSVAWDGTTFQLQDDLYCSDPSDPLYGYGSEQMQTLCDLLRDKRDLEPIADIPRGSEWFRDRFVTLTPCAPRDTASWKRMVQGHGRTCRKPPCGKLLTRRVLRKRK